MVMRTVFSFSLRVLCVFKIKNFEFLYRLKCIYFLGASTGSCQIRKIYLSQTISWERNWTFIDAGFAYDALQSFCAGNFLMQLTGRGAEEDDIPNKWWFDDLRYERTQMGRKCWEKVEAIENGQCTYFAAISHKTQIKNAGKKLIKANNPASENKPIPKTKKKEKTMIQPNCTTKRKGSQSKYILVQKKIAVCSGNIKKDKQKEMEKVIS